MAAEVPPPILFVRPLSGTVRESRRLVHVVPVPADEAIPEFLTAYCGERFAPGTAERLETPAGAPCMSCLALTPAVPGLIGAADAE